MSKTVEVLPLLELVFQWLVSQAHLQGRFLTEKCLPLRLLLVGESTHQDPGQSVRIITTFSPFNSHYSAARQGNMVERASSGFRCQLCHLLQIILSEPLCPQIKP